LCSPVDLVEFQVSPSSKSILGELLLIFRYIVCRRFKDGSFASLIVDRRQRFHEVTVLPGDVTEVGWIRRVCWEAEADH
jgi:hypothetical protein